MSTDLTNVVEQVPAYLQEFVGDAVDNSVYDAPGGSPIAQLSFRGGKWRVRRGPEERSVPGADGYAAAYVDVIIITANPNIRSKAYYEGTFVDGDNKAPRCAASNGQVPDARIANPIHPVCNGCPKDAWRDEIRPDGAKLGGKECKDYKLLAVVPLMDPMNEDAPYMLRVSPDSLGNFNEYRTLHDRFTPKRELCSSITRLSMDPSTSYPKIVFERMGWIPQEAKPAVNHWLNDPHTKRVLLMDVPAGPGYGQVGQATQQITVGPVSAQQPTASNIAANIAESAAAKAAAARLAAIKEEASARVAPNGHAEPIAQTTATQPTPSPDTPKPPPPRPSVVPSSPPPPSAPPPQAAAPQIDPALLAKREALAKAQAQAKAAEAELAALEAAEAAEAAEKQAATNLVSDQASGMVPSSELLAQLDAEFAAIPE